ncbi:MAG: hypothetical protein AAF184_11280 [Pseudomonadota bacterium]
MLPFRHAHYFVLAFLVITLAAFAPTYFLVLDDAPAAHHLHGITATAWIVLLICQSASIHHRHWRLHAWLGRASVLLAPLMVAGGLLVTQVTLLRENSPFNLLFGHDLAVADWVATLAFALFYGLALRHRRDPERHARYMLATLTPLVGPSLARLLANFVPGFAIRAPEELAKFGMALDAAMGLTTLALLVLLVIDIKRRKPADPFLLAIGCSVLMYVGYAWFGPTALWDRLADAFAALPVGQVVAMGLGLGLAAGAIGWWCPHRAHRSEDARTAERLAAAGT